VVYIKETKKSFIEWANRQTALTLLGYKGNLYIGIAYYSAELLLFASGIIMPFTVNPVFAVLLLHFVISEYKAFASLSYKGTRTSPCGYGDACALSLQPSKGFKHEKYNLEGQELCHK